MPNVFLSPSAQTWNYYVTGGTEEQSMNRLCDRVEPWLRSSGIAYVRAPRGQPPSQSILQANAGRFDLYTALHSNAAPEGQYGSYRGVDVYYYQRGQNSRRAALGFAEALRTVYPLPQRVRTAPTLDLGEVTRTRAPAVLLELGYHDNIQDALWLRDDLDAIAQAVASGILRYFDLPLVPPQEPQGAYAALGSGVLRLRARPSVQARVLANIPNGGELTVVGTLEGWYVVQYGRLTGYAAAPYVKLRPGNIS